VQLADFGLAKQLAGEKKFMQTICGTLSYSAPEACIAAAATHAGQIVLVGAV
jgi:serine/threonine protein kinase